MPQGAPQMECTLGRVRGEKGALINTCDTAQRVGMAWTRGGEPQQFFFLFSYTPRRWGRSRRTDYIDLCGEPEFMQRMTLKFHEEAQAKGVLIMHACAFGGFRERSDYLSACASSCSTLLGMRRGIRAEKRAGVAAPVPAGTVLIHAVLCANHAFRQHRQRCQLYLGDFGILHVRLTAASISTVNVLVELLPLMASRERMCRQCSD